MRASKYCVYCGVLMNRIANHDDGRSVEHMIPQVSVSIVRNNGQGDYHACRKCNSNKGKIDEVLGLLCRMAGDNVQSRNEAKVEYEEKVNKGDYRFITAERSKTSSPKGWSIKIPLNGRQIYQYGIWLAKGVYFEKTGEILSNQYLICVEMVNQEQVNRIKEMYKNKKNSEAFDELSMNLNIPNINGESFIISTDDAREIFVCFNRVIMFHLKLLEKNRINETLCNKSRRALY